MLIKMHMDHNCKYLQNLHPVFPKVGILAVLTQSRIIFKKPLLGYIYGQWVRFLSQYIGTPCNVKLKQFMLGLTPRSRSAPRCEYFMPHSTADQCPVCWRTHTQRGRCKKVKIKRLKTLWLLVVVFRVQCSNVW